jgi:hypothetical protein
VGIRSYRSTFSNAPVAGIQTPAERTMCALTMNENVFVLLDDVASPGRLDFKQMNPQPTDFRPPHFSSTFITLNPPGALEQLLAHLRARWVSVRQAAPGGTTQRGQPTGQQLVIEGNIFAIGNDWIVRVGNVILSGGAVKGILLEVCSYNICHSYSHALRSLCQAEYLPLPVIDTHTLGGTSELISDLLTSILPNIRDAKTVAVTISDAQWEEVVEKDVTEEKGSDEEDVYISGDMGRPAHKPADWIGVDRDRRSAYLIIGALKSERIL